MPHTRSAKKQHRKNVKRRLHNRAVKHAIKTQIKKVSASQSWPAEKLLEEFKIAVKELDKAAARGVVHANLAARKKSQMAKLLNQKTAAH